jgi:hypothetical protein
MSDKEETNRSKKKTKRGRIDASTKEENKKSRGKPIRKEADKIKNLVQTKSPKKRQPVFDVEALMETGAKGSMTSKTIAAMTPAQKSDIIDTAHKSLLRVAKKGLRVEAMKVTF